MTLSLSCTRRIMIRTGMRANIKLIRKHPKIRRILRCESPYFHHWSSTLSVKEWTTPKCEEWLLHTRRAWSIYFNWNFLWKLYRLRLSVFTLGYSCIAVVYEYRNRKNRNWVLKMEKRTESNQNWKIQTDPALPSVNQLTAINKQIQTNEQA